MSNRLRKKGDGWLTTKDWFFTAALGDRMIRPHGTGGRGDVTRSHAKQPDRIGADRALCTAYGNTGYTEIAATNSNNVPADNHGVVLMRRVVAVH